MSTENSLLHFIQDTTPVPLSNAEAIAGRFARKTISRNKIFLPEGRICNEFRFLEKGFARAYTFDVQGSEITTNFHPEGQVCCEMFSFFKRVPARENLQALTDCVTWSISFADLQVAFHSMPEFREFGRAVLVTAYAELKTRMLSTFHQTAEERYRQLLETSPDIFQFAPLKQIASYLGVTDTSLSRIRKEFSRRHTD